MDLLSDFTRAQTAYAERLAYATAHRQQERWSKGPLLPTEPFEFERLGLAPGKWLRKQPAATQHKYCYWLTEQGELLATRKGISLANQFYEEFFFVEEGLAKSCLYSNTQQLQNVKTRVWQDGRLCEVFLLGRRGAKHETYQYEGSQLRCIRVHQRNGEQVGTSYTLYFRYQNEQLAEISTEFDTGYREVRYHAKWEENAC
jgi:hypothetical protein